MTSPGQGDRTTTAQKMISASFGSVLNTIALTPLDVVRVRMQSIPHVTGGGGGGSSTLMSGTFAGLKLIVKNDGVSGLWKGLTPTVIMAIPASAVYMAGYENMRDLLYQYDSLKTVAPMIAGTLARAVTTIGFSPLELLRTRVQQTGNESKSILDSFNSLRTAVATRGFRFLYMGLVPSLLRDVPFSASYWLIYENTLRHLERGLGFSHLEAAFMGGTISGSIAAFITTPFDVVKTKRQMEILSHHAAESPQTITQIFQDVWRTRGLSGFFAGVSPRIAKIAPSCAIMISAYELGKSVAIKAF